MVLPSNGRRGVGSRLSRHGKAWSEDAATAIGAWPGLRGRATLSPMFGKMLLTAAVILGAYLVLRTRIQRGREVAAVHQVSREPLIPATTFKAIAYGLVTVMVAGSLLWLYLDWEQGRDLVTVQVINANTGDIVTYQSRRDDVKGRRFTTLDGRTVTLADVERMILAEGQ